MIKPNLKKVRNRTYFLFGTLVLFWSVIIIRLSIIQVIHGKTYQKKCINQVQNKISIEPLRGTILDRNGNPLTIDIAEYSVACHPYLIKDKEAIARLLNQNLPKSYNYYYTKLISSSTYVPLESNIQPEFAHLIQDNRLRYNGLVITKKVKRYYPNAEVCGQLLGFATENEGKCGLEYEFNIELSGVPGWQIQQKDGLGQLIARPDLPYQPAVDGRDIKLTINKEYQTILYGALRQAFIEHHPEYIMGLIINPQNGEILAMSSVPAFNPNSPTKYSVEQQKNRSITDIYEPGSTFKLITATAALEENLITSKDSVDCSGVIHVKGRTIHDHHPYKILSFADIIKKSSNIGTIRVAQRLRKDVLLKYARRYGFGVKTGIPFPGEENGILHDLENWTDLTQAQVAMGHGISCTAIQLAYAYVAIANGGYLLKPVLVKSIQTKDGKTIREFRPEIIRKVASDKTMAILRDLLRLTVISGTGTGADVHGMSIAGKTGTAQKVIDSGYSSTDYYATFVGFFPADNPQLLCVVVLDTPKGDQHTGGLVAAPVVRNIFMEIVNSSNQPFFEPKLQPPGIKIAGQIDKPREKQYDTFSTAQIISLECLPPIKRKAKLMPDLSGTSAREATSILRRLNLNISITGEGTVIEQYPPAGTTIETDQVCRLILASRDSK